MQERPGMRTGIANPTAYPHCERRRTWAVIDLENKV